MRIIFSLLVIALITPVFSSGQKVLKVKRKGVKMINVTKTSKPSSYSVKQFAGKWQEVSRKDRDTNAGVDFTDTLFFHFYDDSEVSVRNGIDLTVKGVAEIQPGNILSTAGDEFIIKSVDKTKAILDENKYIHTLVKKENFWYETLPTDSVMPEKFMNPITISLSDIAGRWSVYRRNALPGTSKNEALIKSIKIENADTNNATGEVTFYQAEKTETLPCTLSISGTDLLISTEKYLWQMKVYKADKTDFVFGNSSLLYYAK